MYILYRHLHISKKLELFLDMVFIQQSDEKLGPLAAI